jgi:hypothetical protein
MKNQLMQQVFIQLISYVWSLIYVSALHCQPQEAFLVPSERWSTEEQSIEYCGLAVGCGSEIATHHDTRYNTPIHNCSSIEHLSEGTRNAP